MLKRFYTAFSFTRRHLFKNTPYIANNKNIMHRNKSFTIFCIPTHSYREWINLIYREVKLKAIFDFRPACSNIFGAFCWHPDLNYWVSILREKKVIFLVSVVFELEFGRLTNKLTKFSDPKYGDCQKRFYFPKLPQKGYQFDPHDLQWWWLCP